MTGAYLLKALNRSHKEQFQPTNLSSFWEARMNFRIHLYYGPTLAAVDLDRNSLNLFFFFLEKQHLL